MVSKVTATPQKVTATPKRATPTPTAQTEPEPIVWLDGVSYEIGNCTGWDFFKQGWYADENEFYNADLYPYEIDTYEYILRKGDEEIIWIKVRNDGKEVRSPIDGTVYSFSCGKFSIWGHVNSAYWRDYGLGMPVNKTRLQEDGFQKDIDYYTDYVLTTKHMRVRLLTFEDMNEWTDLKIELY